MRHTAGVPFHSLPVLSRGSVVLDPSQLTVRVDEVNIQHLAQLEFRLLSVLLPHADQIIPTDNIVEHVWGYCGDRNRDFVRGLVQRLRSKVELANKFLNFIMTEKDLGYYLKIND